MSIESMERAVEHKLQSRQRELEGFLVPFVESSNAANADEAKDYILRHHSDNLIRWWIDNTPEWQMVGAQTMDMSEFYADALRGNFPTVQMMDERKRQAREVALADLDNEFDLEATIEGIMRDLGMLSNRDAEDERRMDARERGKDMIAGGMGR